MTRDKIYTYSNIRVATSTEVMRSVRKREKVKQMFTRKMRHVKLYGGRKVPQIR